MHSNRFHFTSGRGFAFNYDLSRIVGDATIADCDINELNDCKVHMYCGEIVQDFDKSIHAH